MRASASAFAFISLLGLSSAVPTPVELAPRCGTTLLPSFLQQLTEADPNAIRDNTLLTTSDFHVAQSIDTSGQVINRIYQVVGFSGIPAGSSACQLNVKFPDAYPITTSGNPALNVTTLYNDSPASIVSPNDYSWAKFFPPTSPPFGLGLFGTTNLSPGQNSVINSQGCPVEGGNMAFVFEIASWVYGAASIEFVQSNVIGDGLAGVYLTHNC